MTDYSIKRFHKYSDSELIELLRAYAQNASLSFVSYRGFSKATGTSDTTTTNHFGSWRTFCEGAGLAPRNQRAVSCKKLFENLDRVWLTLGRQPRAKEMKQPLSLISLGQYQREFKKPWYDICLEFLSWKSGTSVAEIERDARASVIAPIDQSARTIRREISLSLRYNILKRDGFRCVKCGRSPATDTGVELHVDHIIPWASGGKTILANLQCLCSQCNLGKSNRHDD